MYLWPYCISCQQHQKHRYQYKQNHDYANQNLHVLSLENRFGAYAPYCPIIQQKKTDVHAFPCTSAIFNHFYASSQSLQYSSTTRLYSSSESIFFTVISSPSEIPSKRYKPSSLKESPTTS